MTKPTVSAPDEIQKSSQQSSTRLVWAIGLVGGLTIGGFLGRLVQPSDNATPPKPPLLGDFPSEISDFEPSTTPDWPVSVTADSSEATFVRPVDGEQEAEAPKPLPFPSEAAPLGALPLARGNASPLLESLLESELPHANRAERDVWTDVLGGLPLDDAREILRMRKHLSTGPIVGPRLGSVHAPHTPTPALSRPKVSPFQSSLAALEKAAAVLQHNIANADTIGFLPGQPMLAESPSGVGTTFLRERIDVFGWEPFQTHRFSDIAPAVGSFIAVESEHGQLLTVLGHLVSDNGFVAVDFGDQILPVDPPVKTDGVSLAEAAREVVLWKVDAPSHLERLGAGRFKPTLKSGLPSQTELESSAGVLATGDVKVEDEQRKLQLLKVRQTLLSGESLDQ